MSRGLGPVQVAALGLIGDAEDGVSAVDLATMLGLAARRGRKLVASLIERGEVVVVVYGTPGRRLFTPEHYDEWLRRQPKHMSDPIWVQFVLDQCLAAGRRGARRG